MPLQILGTLGVPEDAMVEFGDGVSSTYEEARALVDWVRSSGARSLIIPTDIFTSRRTRWIFRGQLAPMGCVLWCNPLSRLSTSSTTGGGMNTD